MHIDYVCLHYMLMWNILFNFIYYTLLYEDEKIKKSWLVKIKIRGDNIMKYNKLKLSNAHEILYEYNKDYNPFGNRRYSWYFLRDKNVEFFYEYSYLLYSKKRGNSFSLLDDDSQYVLVCTQGEYLVRLFYMKEECSVSLSAEKRNQVLLGKGVKAEIEAVTNDCQLEIMCENPLDNYESDADMLIIDKKTSGINIIKNVNLENYLLKTYDRKIFMENGINIDLLFTNIEEFEYRNTFRGLYLQEAPRSYASMITCLKGSAIIYAVDMRKSTTTYRQGYSFKLEDEKVTLCFEKGFALGMLSLEDKTVISQKVDEYFDKKYQHRINLTSCDKTKDIDKNSLIISALDKYAEDMEEDFMLKL